jgi:hypothetical protein
MKTARGGFALSLFLGATGAASVLVSCSSGSSTSSPSDAGTDATVVDARADAAVQDATTGDALGPDSGPRCQVQQLDPYMNSPYPGLHATASNAERIPCSGPLTAPTPGWSVLPDRLVFNPVTVATHHLYAIAARTSGCKLYEVTLRRRRHTRRSRRAVEP